MLQRPNRLVLKGIRIALAVGYGGLLCLLVFLGIYSAKTLANVERVDAQSSRIFVERSDKLEALLQRAYAAGAGVRDYLVDPAAEAEEGHRQEARQGWRATLEAFEEYRRVASPDRKVVVAHIEADLGRYWAVAGPSLELTAERRAREGYEVLTSRLTPLRDQLWNTLNEARMLDRYDLRASINAAAMQLQILLSRLWFAVIVCVMLGVALATATWTYLLRLEREAQQQYSASVEFSGRLEQLSQRVLGVQEEERRRVARELHDEVGQSLGALLVDLGQAEGALNADELQPAEHLKAARKLAESTLGTVRNMTLLLRPSMLDDLGLVPALYWQARETSRRTGIDVRVVAERDEIELPDPLRTTIYRIVQEALQNAAKHSRAGLVEIVLQADGGKLRMLIRDDGQGFDPKTTRGIGLLGMQERVSQLGGDVVLESAPGRGTLLKVQLPLDQSEIVEGTGQ